MADKRFNIVFSGKLMQGSNPAEVLAKLCTVLALEPQQVRELFKGGSGAVILKDLDGSRAYAMRDELGKAGAVCSVQEIISHAAEPRPAHVSRGAAPPSGRSPTDLRPAWQPPPVSQNKGSGVISFAFKIVVVAALAGGGWWGYREYFAPPSPAFQAYAAFAEALAREQYDKAAEAATGQARSDAEMLVQMMAPANMKIYGRDFTMSKPSIASIAGDIAWIKLKRKAETKNEAGKVVLQVEETVCRVPPGVASAICKWPVTFRHEAEVVQLEGTWKVSSFQEERLTPKQ